MSIEAIQEQIRILGADDRRKLIAFMVSLDDQNRPGYAQMLAKRIDDQSPDRWLTLEECERRLRLSGQEP